jgi:antitoxin ParD1/3/4
MSVSLTPKLKAYVQRKVRSGQYESASEVIRQGLRTLQENEAADRIYWDEVRAKVAEAKRSVANGDVVDGHGFIASKIEALKSLSSKRRTRKPA